MNELLLWAAIFVPGVIAWFEQRSRAGKMHTENQVRLGAIETKLEPVWEWWKRQ